MKCIILNFDNATVDIISYDAKVIDDVEDFLATRYKMENIQYMCVEEVIINHLED